MEETILVLDDEPGITILCERLLKRAGYTVKAFTMAKKAMRYLESTTVNLLLVDIRMPDIDGFEVIRRAKEAQPDIAILVMTGFGTVETAIQALRQGVDGLLLKPFERGEELVTAVKQALVDNESKRDAARIQALRPLFRVSESLFAETHPSKLFELINTAVLNQLHCSHAGYYQITEEEGDIRLLASTGEVFEFDNDKDQVKFHKTIRSMEKPLLINVTGPGDLKLRPYLKELGLGAALFVPITRMNVRSLFFAGRNMNESPFRDVDLDLFQILANQALVALENARLYRELREYVKQVEESQQAMLQAEKMAAAGRLTASIAHEVNNPLQAVQNCLHLADRKDLSEAQKKEYFDLAKTELDRLMATVRRMLDYYRPGAIAPSKVDAIELLQHVLDLMAKQLEERNIVVKTKLAATIPSIFGVSNQIQQVFINVILNAFDAMPDGGELVVEAREVKGGLEIQFQDSGPGVSDERLAHIFEPFYSTKDGGTGLGLTVSYNIVTAHSGKLECIANNKPGACFRLFLPVGGK